MPLIFGISPTARTGAFPSCRRKASAPAPTSPAPTPRARAFCTPSTKWSSSAKPNPSATPVFKNSSIFYAGAFTVLLWVAQGPAAKIDAPHVSIALPDDVASETVQIRYFLTGPFGGYGGYLKQETGGHSYQIPASVDGKAANEMRLIVF